MSDATADLAPGETRWAAPAKLNLFLHVTGRRADGYHELQTVFQLIDLCDTIVVRVSEDGRIERPAGPTGVDPEADLTVRAARALQGATGCRLGASLRILKRIPLGGGLGGGSSDAATTLLALNHLWGCGLSVDELARLGLPSGRMSLFLFEVLQHGPRGSASGWRLWSCRTAGMSSFIRASASPLATCSRALN